MPACCRRSACWSPTSCATTRRRCGNPADALSMTAARRHARRRSWRARAAIWRRKGFAEPAPIVERQHRRAIRRAVVRAHRAVVRRISRGVSSPRTNAGSATLIDRGRSKSWRCACAEWALPAKPALPAARVSPPAGARAGVGSARADSADACSEPRSTAGTLSIPAIARAARPSLPGQRRRSSCRRRSRFSVDGFGNVLSDARTVIRGGAACTRPRPSHRVRGVQAPVSLDRRRDGRHAPADRLLAEHQGASRLLVRGLRPRRADDRAGRSHARAPRARCRCRCGPRSTPARMEPGDVVMVNDPFQGGTHLPDITLVSPVFLAGDRRPTFYVANRAHHSDVGGMSPGSMPVATRDLPGRL